MNVREIVKEYIKANGYDGLMASDHECGCSIEELAPCGIFNGDCLAAYKWPGEKGYDFIMRTEKCKGGKFDKLKTGIKDARFALANLAVELRVSRPDKYEETINTVNVLGMWLEEIEAARLN